MSFDDQRLERVERPRGGLGNVRRRQKLIQQGRIAHHRPRVGQRQLEFGVVILKPSAFVHLAHVMTDGETEVPQWIQKRMEKLLFTRPDGGRKQHQQIDV